MPVHLQEVEEFLDDLEDVYIEKLQLLEKEIIKGRDKKNIPIYLTKWRLKTPDSIFLKLKRKLRDNLDDIDDIGGLRILCLFDQDISEVYDYLISDVLDIDEVTELRVYDDPDRAKLLLSNKAIKSNKKIIKKQESKQSGYKSVHFKIMFNYKRKDCFI